MATGKSRKTNSARCVRKAVAFPVVGKADLEPDQKVVARDVRKEDPTRLFKVVAAKAALKLDQVPDRRVALKALPAAVAEKVVHPAANLARSVRNLRNSRS